MKANRKVEGLGFRVQVSRPGIQAFYLKALLMVLVVFAGFAAYADVPPPKNTVQDTTLKVGGGESIGNTYGQPVEMATGMRSSGKIYVVVAVLSMILMGLFIYLFTLDKKISKLEKEK
ncbi:MAG: hypothetical protein V4722_27780 [Bacteroidota bacterium]